MTGEAVPCLINQTLPMVYWLKLGALSVLLSTLLTVAVLLP